MSVFQTDGVTWIVPKNVFSTSNLNLFLQFPTSPFKLTQLSRDL